MKDTAPHKGPRAGDILIAHPDMPENVFARTLVFLHTFSDEGALGFILNRPLGQVLGQIASGQALPTMLKRLPLFYGGPVHSDHFILTHFLPDTSGHSFHCEMNPDPKQIQSPKNRSSDILRACMGFAGWSAGQLEDEIHRGDWTWTSSDKALLRDPIGPATWNLLSSGDQRWKLLRSYLPPETGLN